jgi:hypothetical protein
MHAMRQVNFSSVITMSYEQSNPEFPENLTGIFLGISGNFITITANFQSASGMQKMAVFINSNPHFAFELRSPWSI